ncbi:MAG: TAT-variant-translocated molybdopterin oxidoreductase [Bacteroidetes bacterium]|nr:TAT-variant-translocated molybdopterin oxidoreductase [Bacteroidota bacterium]
MSTKKYWKGLEELANTPEFQKSAQNEFAESIPVEDFLQNDSLDKTSTSRRDFLKYLGFSVTAASLAACETPVTKAVPYVVKPEEITPGVANWYASTYFDGSDYASILVKTREGRPIKIEGNKLSKITRGGTNARIQASVLSLYDSARITAPYAKGAPSTWDTVDKEISEKLASSSAIRILTSTIISPSTKAVIEEFKAKHPSAKHVTYDAVSYSALIKANWHSFDKGVVPTYNFEKANVIVSVGADFLGTWLSPIEFSKQYAINRKVGSKKKEMSKHYQFESILSLSGSNADKRFPIKPSQTGLIVLNLYNAVAKLAGVVGVGSAASQHDAEIAKIAKHLLENKGKSLVVCGANDVAIQFAVNSINSLLGNYSKTIDLENYSNLKQGDDERFADFVKEMKDGKVDALFVYNANPVYNTSASLAFSEAMKKVKLKVSFGDRVDETSELCDYVCPDHHYLESWNDANPSKAQFSLQQPTINPIFSKPKYEGTRSAQESLLKWSGNNSDYLSYIKKHWSSHVFPMQGKHMMFTEFWNNSLHDGVVEIGFGKPENAPNVVADSTASVGIVEKVKEILGKDEKQTSEEVKDTNRMSINDASAAISKSAKGGNWEVVLYEKVSMGNGNQANNPWLQEMPDPISKVTWDNYITMNPIDMKGKYNLLERYNQMEDKADVAKITVNGTTIELPVFPQPGQALGTVGVALGYGRTKAGKCADNVGKNAFTLVGYSNSTFNYNLTAELSEKTGELYQLACTQTHHTMMGRSIVKETDLTTFATQPKQVWNHSEMISTHKGAKPVSEVNLWADHDKLGHRWGLTIDLNSCIGCGSCIVSCNAENNVPVVGKEEVRRSREMHWMRIDRYYTSDMTKEKAEEEHVGAIDMYLKMENPTAENPKVVFQPVMCQHCNHAPCETVCPVLATNHSSEGLNQMTYNRCVGTRYCANNCPYKVRRFNWFEYDRNHRFTGINPSQDDLGRMVLNPDVTVRSRGVMEKCSMCVQRVQEGKLNAKKQNRKLGDGDFTTACAQSCPTDAITFGDLNNSESVVAQLFQEDRSYFLLEEVGIKPSVSYLVKVRNEEPSEIAASHGGHGNHGEEKHEEKKEKAHS